MEAGGRLTVRTAAGRRWRRTRWSSRCEDTGHGHPARGAAQDLRAVLHHQAAGPRHRPRALHLLRHRGGAPRAASRWTASPGSAAASSASSCPARCRRMKILVVEDDRDRRPVREARARGAALPRRPGRRRPRGRCGSRPAGHYDLIILDLRLPGMTGLEVLRTLRDRGAHDADPRADGAGRGGLQGAGAARRRRRLRHQAVRLRGTAGAGGGARPPAQAAARPGAARSATSSSTPATREVRRAGELIELTPKEYTVLEYLMRHAGRVMSPHADHRVRLGLSLRSRHQHRGRGDQPAAQEDRFRARTRS